MLVRLRIRYYSVGSTQAELPVPNKTKVWDSVDEAVKDVRSGDTLLSGGVCADVMRSVGPHPDSLQVSVYVEHQVGYIRGPSVARRLSDVHRHPDRRSGKAQGGDELDGCVQQRGIRGEWPRYASCRRRELVPRMLTSHAREAAALRAD